MVVSPSSSLPVRLPAVRAVSSSSSPIFQRLRAVQRQQSGGRRGRGDESTSAQAASFSVLVEGRRLIADLGSSSRWTLLNLLLTPTTLSAEMQRMQTRTAHSPAAQGHVHDERPSFSLLSLLPATATAPSTEVAGAPFRSLRSLPSVLRLSEPLLSRLSSTATCSGYLAEFAVPPSPPLLPSLATLLLDGVADPVNIGLLARSAAAFGFSQLLTRAPSAHPLSQKAIAASAGSLGRVTVGSWEGEGEGLLTEARRLGVVQVVGLVAAGGLGVEEVRARLRRGCCAVWLVVGNESRGISAELLQRCDLLLTLPLHPSVESLNAHTAAAIACYALTTR